MILFTDYYSSITVDDLSCNTIIVLQYNSFYCNTLPAVYSSSVLQYNTPSLAIHLLSLAIYLHFPCNAIFPHAANHCLSQYNFVYCNTRPAHPRCFIAIQFLVLQYNFPAFKPSLAIQFFTKKKKIILQYKPSATKLPLQYTFFYHNIIRQ